MTTERIMIIQEFKLLGIQLHPLWLGPLSAFHWKGSYLTVSEVLRAETQCQEDQQTSRGPRYHPGHFPGNSDDCWRTV